MTLRPPPLPLDFCRKERRAWAGWLVLGIGVSLATGIAAVGWRASERVDELTSQLARSGSEVRQHATAETDPAVLRSLDEQIREANLALAQLTLPWQALIASVERAATPGVALLALQPDTRKRAIAITAEAANHAAMTEFWRSLSASPNLEDVVVTEFEINERDPQRPVRFIILGHFARENAPPVNR